MFSSLLLYYIVSLHQTTTYSRQKDLALCCIISFLYIKPQPSPHANNWCVVVLYRFSTSNHNITKILWHPLTLYYIVSLHQTTTRLRPMLMLWKLYYIVSLHQTTTELFVCSSNWELYYIVSLHQTTTVNVAKFYKYRCIISFLYIKPQLLFVYIVSLHQTTTGKNKIRPRTELYYIVSLHQTTTESKPWLSG